MFSTKLVFSSKSMFNIFLKKISFIKCKPYITSTYKQLVAKLAIINTWSDKQERKR